jgi:DNA-binding NarL/FixJ family response regulator
MIRVFLTGDQRTPESLRPLLQSEPDLQLVGTATCIEDTARQIEQLDITLKPDVVLVDSESVVAAITTVQMLSHHFTETKVLVLTITDDDLISDLLTKTLPRKAASYLQKDISPRELVNAIRFANEGYIQFAPDIFQKVIAKLNAEVKPFLSSDFVFLEALSCDLSTLSSREQEVLCWIAKGADNREIAQALYISEKTVKNHVNSILGQLNLRDRTQAAIVANFHSPPKKARLSDYQKQILQPIHFNN